MTTQEATIRRGVRNARYSTIPNHVFEDGRLSMEARWLLGYLLSKPDNWIVRVKDIRNMGNCGRDKATSMVNELVSIGYAEKEQRREGGKFGNAVLVIYDEPRSMEDQQKQGDSDSVASLPQTPLPSTVQPLTAEPSTVNPAHSKYGYITNTDDTNLRESAGEREGVGKGEEGEDDHKRLTKRVKAMEIGKAGNPWPGAVGSSTGWAVTQFEKLSPAERQTAEDRRDPYLAICKAQGVKPVALGVYYRDHKFLDVTAHAAKAAGAKIGRVAVKPFGPVWAGMLAYALALGPKQVEMPGDPWDAAERTYALLAKVNPQRTQAYLDRKGISLDGQGKLLFPDDFQKAEYLRLQCDEGFPLVRHLYKLASDRGAELTDGRNQHLAPLCEAVPVGTPVYDAWRAHYQAMNWPLWPDPGTMRVVYFPTGGPVAMGDFMHAARAAMEGEGHADAA